MKSNDRYRFLIDTEISINDISHNNLLQLLEHNYIRESDRINKYIITAKGIWHIETSEGSSEDTLIEYIDEKFFDLSLGNMKITDKEKVIIFSMISARAFSDNVLVDLKKSEYTLNTWKSIIDECYEKLYTMQIVSKLETEELYGKHGNEHIVSNLLRHTDALPKKTKGIYKVIRPQKYYLDIIDEFCISKEKLDYIIKMVFDANKHFSVEEIDGLCSFCSSTAYNVAPLVYDMKIRTFASPEYDDVIDNSIKDVLYSL